ncbi:hypothetical protein GS399_11090 [Pedobacter sp. HMF7647]|uniref:Yip1 domain-containing protein n=1 Tax=Hufsiella arboris TaxID=2695275 RepID=A0A7K1YAB1_9SPHI|nr:hypothetical protein [Hufsiella arboris]
MDETYKSVIAQLLFGPRKAFDVILRDNLNKYQLLFITLAGISNSFGRAIGIGNSYTLPVKLIFIICTGILIGLIIPNILAATISFTGKWFGGAATPKQVLLVISFALIPVACFLGINIVRLLIFGGALFGSNFNAFNSGSVAGYFFLITHYIQAFLIVPYAILLFVGLSEAQGFPFWKSILNVLVACLLIVVPMMLMVVLVMVVAG